MPGTVAVKLRSRRASALIDSPNPSEYCRFFAAQTGSPRRRELPENPALEANPRSSSRALALVVNGDARWVAAGATVADLVAELGLAGRKIAIAVNRDVVPRASYAARALHAGDRVEILEAVGGG